MQNLISNNQIYLELYQKGVFVYIYIYMGGGPNLTPYIIYQEVYLSPLSLYGKQIYIYIYTLSLYIYISLSLYIYIYIYEGGPNLAPYGHVIVYSTYAHTNLKKKRSLGVNQYL